MDLTILLRKAFEVRKYQYIIVNEQSVGFTYKGSEIKTKRHYIIVNPSIYHDSIIAVPLSDKFLSDGMTPKLKVIIE